MNNQNKEHHDINDVCHRLDRLISYVTQIGNAILLAENLQIDLLTSIDKRLASIDEKTPPVSDEDIGTDGGTIATTQKE